jgi:hypothetical protein
LISVPIAIPITGSTAAVATFSRDGAVVLNRKSNPNKRRPASPAGRPRRSSAP